MLLLFYLDQDKLKNCIQQRDPVSEISSINIKESTSVKIQFEVYTIIDLIYYIENTWYPRS